MKKIILQKGDLFKFTEITPCCDSKNASFYNKTLNWNAICIFLFEKHNEVVCFHKEKVFFCYAPHDFFKKI